MTFEIKKITDLPITYSKIISLKHTFESAKNLIKLLIKCAPPQRWSKGHEVILLNIPLVYLTIPWTILGLVKENQLKMQRLPSFSFWTGLWNQKISPSNNHDTS